MKDDNASEPAIDFKPRFSELGKARRIVVKIGTNTLTRASGDCGLSPRGKPDSAIDVEYLHRVAEQVADLTRQGKQVLIVTSGAIGMGARELGLEKRVTDIDMRQACAAIGQPLLMNEYHRAFGVYGLSVAQVLVTRDVLDNRVSYLNLRESVDKLLEMKVIPVFNENDTISTAEIGNAFGDNDRLSAYIASKTDAELLILLSDIDCLYTADPRQDPDAKPVRWVESISKAVKDSAGDRGSEFSTGGMKTKIQAVEIARDAGCRVIIANGREKDVIRRISAGEAVGTLFEADEPLKNRTRWIKNATPQGRLTIDTGAMEALRRKNSLLPKGVVSVEGAFDRQSVVLVNGEVKLVSLLSSAELDATKGMHSSDAATALGNMTGTVVIARPEDMAWLGE